MQPELGVVPFTVPTPLPAESEPPKWQSVPQPFAVGERVIVIANKHVERDTVNLIGRTGTVRQVIPYPTDQVMECGVLLDPLPDREPNSEAYPPPLVVGGIEVVYRPRPPEEHPRLFPPSALARLDPEFGPYADDELDAD